MIVGTAGHIDHGKTTLVRVLTGVDTDRLPEEKARGISIELGYAYLDVPMPDERPGARPPEAGTLPPRGVDGISGRGLHRIGFIDVPGHEKLVHTMLAGAGGIDMVLLVIAADEGVMPQTREHLDIIDFLEVDRGVVALTKSDLVDDEGLEIARLDAEEAIASTSIKGAAIIPVSSTTGAGQYVIEKAFVEQ